LIDYQVFRVLGKIFIFNYNNLVTNYIVIFLCVGALLIVLNIERYVAKVKICFRISYKTTILGDGVAKHNKASVATCTKAGSKPRPWVAFFFGKSRCPPSGERCHHPSPGHGRYLRGRGALKICPNCVNVFKPIVPSLSNKNHKMAQVSVD